MAPGGTLVAQPSLWPPFLTRPLYLGSPSVSLRWASCLFISCSREGWILPSEPRQLKRWLQMAVPPAF